MHLRMLVFHLMPGYSATLPVAYLFGCHRYISINAMNRFGQRNVFSAHDAALIFWSNSNFPQLTRQRLERYCCRFVKVHLLIRPCRNSRMTFSSAWQFPRASATCPGVLAMSHGNCVSRCTEEAGWDIFPMIFLRIKKRSRRRCPRQTFKPCSKIQFHNAPQKSVESKRAE